jgi:hypothetical protein
VVARAQGADLVQATLLGPSAERVRARLSQTTAILSALEIFRNAIALFHRPTGALMEHRPQLPGIEAQGTRSAYSAGDVLKQGCHQALHVRAQGLRLDART